MTCRPLPIGQLCSLGVGVPELLPDSAMGSRVNEKGASDMAGEPRMTRIMPATQTS